MPRYPKSQATPRRRSAISLIEQSLRWEARARVLFTVGDAETAAADLTITVSSSDQNVIPDANIAAGGSGATRTVTVTPASGITDVQRATITVTVTDPSQATASDTFVVTVDPAADQVPTIGDIGNQRTPPGIATSAIPFLVGDVETAAADLTVTATSSDTTLVPATGIVISGSGANRTITTTPAANEIGTATITVTVTDAAGNTATDTFNLIVDVPPNTPPTISNIGNQSATSGVATAAISFIIGDAETAVADLMVTATSSNTTLLAASGIVLGGTTSERSIKLTPAAAQSGTTTVTVTVTDLGGLTASDSFDLIVSENPGTDPTISDIGDQSTTIGMATFAIPFTVDDAETAVAELTVTATSDNATLLPASGIVLGGSGASRTITLTPAAGETGTATVTVTVTDDDFRIARDAFDLTVRPSSGGDPVVTVSPTGPGGDPDPLPGTSGQPTSWASQRSSLRQITVDLPITPAAVTVNDLVLTNLGLMRGPLEMLTKSSARCVMISWSWMGTC